MFAVEFKSCTYQRFLFEIVGFCNYSLKRNNAHQQTRIKSEFIFMFSFVLLCSHHHQNVKKVYLSQKQMEIFTLTSESGCICFVVSFTLHDDCEYMYLGPIIKGNGKGFP